MSDLESTRPIGRVTRIGRLPDPWGWPPWEAQHSDNTFGNRWDDPDGMYRVVYACTQLEGAYVEVLSRFRPDPVVVAELAAIEGPSGEYVVSVVPASWLAARAIGEATLAGLYADVGHARSLTYLRTVMAPRLIHHDISDLDAAAIRISAHLQAVLAGRHAALRRRRVRIPGRRQLPELGDLRAPRTRSDQWRDRSSRAS